MIQYLGFPGGAVVQNLPANTGDVDSTSSRGTKIPHAMRQLSLCTPTAEPQLEIWMSQQEITHDTMTIPPYSNEVA